MGQGMRHRDWDVPASPWYPRDFPGGQAAWGRMPNEWHLLLREYSDRLLTSHIYPGVRQRCQDLHRFFHMLSDGGRVEPEEIRLARHWLREVAEILEMRSDQMERNSWPSRAALGLWQLRNLLPKHPERYYPPYDEFEEWGRRPRLPRIREPLLDWRSEGMDVPYIRRHRRLDAPGRRMIPSSYPGRGMGMLGMDPGYGYGGMGGMGRMLGNGDDGKTLRTRGGGLAQRAIGW